MCCFYAATYVKLCQRHAQVPRLTDGQEAAFAEFERLANSDELCMHYKLEVGDIQLLNNHTMVSWASWILYLLAAQSSAVTPGCMQGDPSCHSHDSGPGRVSASSACSMPASTGAQPPSPRCCVPAGAQQISVH